NKNPVLLVEAARQALRRSLIHPLLGDDGKLTVVTLDPVLEDEISRAVEPAAAGGPGLQPAFLRRVIEGLRRVGEESAAPLAPVLLCGSPARFYLRRLVEPFLPKLVILSPGEIPPRVAVQSLGSVR
ncbi:MAG: FHIPEP family type III secretion protein, partial [Terriglobales bacterium]